MRRTQAVIARELLARLRRGPTLKVLDGSELTPAEAEARVRAWLSSWIIDDVAALAPALRVELAFEQVVRDAAASAAEVQA